MTESILSGIRRASGWSIVLGALIILLGIIAVMAPLATGVVAVSVLAWTAIFGGAAQILYSFQVYSSGRLILEAILGAIYLAAGVYLMANPIAGLLTLTFLLGCLLLGYGIIAVALAFRMRPLQGWGWVLFDACITALLGFMIVAHWPISAEWAIGTLFGLSILFSGVTRLMVSLGVRDVTAAAV